ncbi:hypothetical protein [Picosynechococcus sp. PCC 73109]|uniref:hypothetical protein n=1 Tax=Picosynechococcus sp. PCC 73109 TaxID=374982 RepID=UPI000AF7968A|nr:hypothetical protein [Picosynechococcus sp. PCC 73109]
MSCSSAGICEKNEAIALNWGTRLSIFPTLIIQSLNLPLELPMSQTTTEPFKPQQIVCLVAGDRRLYGAVIQFIEAQASYWLRPLCLLSATAEAPTPLHRSADIIIAAPKIRAALDTEILDCWSVLYDDSGDYGDNVAGRKLVQDFLRSLDWGTATQG